MKKLNEKTTEKILKVLTLLYDEPQSLTKACKKAGLNTYYMSFIRDTLLEKNLIYKQERFFVWNKSYSAPNADMAKNLHLIINNKARKYHWNRRINLSDEELVSILRERGYTVTATKEIPKVIETMETISL